MRCIVWFVELFVVNKFIRLFIMVFVLMIWLIGVYLLLRLVMCVECIVVVWVSVLCSFVFGLMNDELGRCNFIIFMINWLELVVL